MGGIFSKKNPAKGDLRGENSPYNSIEIPEGIDFDKILSQNTTNKTEFPPQEQKNNKPETITNLSLHTAAFNGDFYEIKKLIENDANIHAKDKFGRTPLHMAVMSGSLRCVKELYEKGEDINAKYHNPAKPLNEKTPLDLAYIYGSTHADIIQFLASKGAKREMPSFTSKIMEELNKQQIQITK